MIIDNCELWIIKTWGLRWGLTWGVTWGVTWGLQTVKWLILKGLGCKTGGLGEIVKIQGKMEVFALSARKHFSGYTTPKVLPRATIW